MNTYILVYVYNGLFVIHKYDDVDIDTNMNVLQNNHDDCKKLDRKKVHAV